MLASAAAILGAVAIGLPLVLYLAQDRLLFFPQPLDEARRAQALQRHPGAQELFLDEGGRRLHAWHVPGDPLIVYFGGNAEDVSWMLAEGPARAPGAGWLLVSYPGYGGASGTPSAEAIAEDALRWHDHIAGRAKPRRIFAFGRSLGSGAAVALAARRPLAGAILVAPFDSLAEVAAHHYPVLPVRLLLRHRFESAALAPGLRLPLLCLVAERDTIIPVVHSRRLYDAWAGPKRWVELAGAGHNSTDDSPAFWPAVNEFLAKNTNSR